jgi:hypothetical protein
VWLTQARALRRSSEPNRHASGGSAGWFSVGSELGSQVIHSAAVSSDMTRASSVGLESIAR